MMRFCYGCVANTWHRLRWVAGLNGGQVQAWRCTRCGEL